MPTNKPKPHPVVLRVLEAAPCSSRALARAAGLSPAQLSRLASGERQPTPATAEALASGLELWAETCARLAKDMRRVARTLANGKDA